MFMDVTRERLFTPRFFLMCGFSFAVFFSAFQLFPTAPFRIRDLGGGTFAAGLFLACLTFASAVSAPLTGAMADRFGLRRTLRVGGVALTLFSAGYAVLSGRDYRVGEFVVVKYAAPTGETTDDIDALRVADGAIDPLGALKPARAFRQGCRQPKGSIGAWKCRYESLEI